MHRSLPYLLGGTVIVVVAVLLWSHFAFSTKQQALPQGPQTLTGTIIPAELSLTRRGTHVLKVDGKNTTYLESAAVNLRTYELTEAAVTGTFSYNTDPTDLPVLTVTSIRPIDIPARSIDVPQLNLTLRVPLDWAMQQFDDGVTFTLTGSTTVLLRVSNSPLLRLPAGTPMFVAGYDAVRSEGSDGSQTVSLQAGRTIVTFVWTPGSYASLEPAFAQMLRTAIVRAASSSGSGTILPPRPSGTGAVQGQPCGGPAGILCPSGSFCSVTGADGVGTCVAF